jgi:hypothetical protein
MNKHERSYIYELKQPNGDRYSFIAVDACVEPGPRRPFNFFGSLEPEDLELLDKYAKQSILSNGTIWFGHYPTTTVHSSKSFRQVMSTGAAYLCGHLHTLGGLVPSMYTRHSNGLLELELADWKVGRMFRLMAFDAGLFTFHDFKLSKYDSRNSIFVLITNPKNIQFKTSNGREPLDRMRRSSHIRMLIFAKYAILTASVFIDDIYVGEAQQLEPTSPLYTLKWNPSLYNENVHKMSVVIKDQLGNLKTVQQEFSLDHRTYKPFKFLPNFLLTSDQIKLVVILHYYNI